MSEQNYFDELREAGSFIRNTGKDKGKVEECFRLFDTNSDGALDPVEFHAMCTQLFVNGDQPSPSLNETLSRQIFDQLNEKKDGRIDREEFDIIWKDWLPLVLIPKSGLIVVDVQNDFISGSLIVPKAEETIPIINDILSDVEFEQVFYSYDWHPTDHVSFFENLYRRDLAPSSPITKEDAKVFDTVIFDGPVPMEQTLWPTHCVQGSWGAELHPNLTVIAEHTDIYKGEKDYVDSYSAFFDNQHLSQTKLAEELTKRRITDVYVTGLGFDICSRQTAIDSSNLGFSTFVVEDALRGITEEGTQKAREDMVAAGCDIISTSQVKALVTGKKRCPFKGLKAARNVAEARVKASDARKKSGHASSGANEGD